jgi:hypothetical protein
MLPPGLALLSLVPSFGLAFRQYVANRAANRLYSPSRLFLLATQSRTATRCCHFLGVLWHFEPLSVRAVVEMAGVLAGAED